MKSLLLTGLKKYGWKTFTGTALLAAGQLLPLVWPEGQKYVPVLNSLGTVLGGVGIRMAISKSEEESC